MKIALVRKTATRPYHEFFMSGWESVNDVDIHVGMEYLSEIDGQYDLCIVHPGGFHPDTDLVIPRKSSKTKFVFVNEEDMHHPFDWIRSIALHYDHLFMFSDRYTAMLRAEGVQNTTQILPMADSRFFRKLWVPKTFDVSFLGQQDDVIKIGGGTRKEYLTQIDSNKNLKSFIGRGFYADAANQIYCQSKICLDIPICDVVGPRSVQIGASGSMLILPKDPARNSLWYKCFNPGEDYIEFDGIDSLSETLEYWLSHDEEREKIARNMHQKIHGHTPGTGHTFQNRLNRIILKSINGVDIGWN